MSFARKNSQAELLAVILAGRRRKKKEERRQLAIDSAFDRSLEHWRTNFAIDVGASCDGASLATLKTGTGSVPV